MKINQLINTNFQLIIFLIIGLCFIKGSNAQGGTYVGTHIFNSGDTGVYPTNSIVTHPAGTVTIYPAGMVISFNSPTYLQFQGSLTTMYTANGPTVYPRDTTVLFPAGYLISVAPGTKFRHPAEGSISYRGFHGNNASIVTYETTTTVQFSCPNSHPSYFPVGTNPINYFNPGVQNTGGLTQFGRSSPSLNSVQQKINSDGTFSNVVCTSFTETGWPIRTITNLQNANNVVTSRQSGPNTYTISYKDGTTFTIQSNISYYL